MMLSLSLQESTVAQLESMYYEMITKGVIHNYSSVTPFGRIQFCLFVCLFVCFVYEVFFSVFLRKGYNWFSWDWLWKNRCICTASSSDTAWKSSEVICSRSYSDKVCLGPILVLHKDYITYLYTSNIFRLQDFFTFPVLQGTGISNFRTVWSIRINYRSEMW